MNNIKTVIKLSDKLINNLIYKMFSNIQGFSLLFISLFLLWANYQNNQINTFLADKVNQCANTTDMDVFKAHLYDIKGDVQKCAFSCIVSGNH